MFWIFVHCAEEPLVVIRRGASGTQVQRKTATPGGSANALKDSALLGHTGLGAPNNLSVS